MASATHDEKIAPTAHYTAYVWHHVGMPHGALFATPLGRALFWGFRLAGEGFLPRIVPGVPSMAQYLELRHRSIESVLEDERPDVVVEIGAGLSRRGVTWAERGVRYVEIDLPAMSALKQRLIAERASPDLRARISGKLSHVAADVLAEGFERELARMLEGASRPIVIAEGVLAYFAPEHRRQLVRSVASALSGRGAFVCDLRTEEGSRSMRGATALLKGSIRLVTKGRGTRQDFADEGEVRRFFAECGLANAEPVPRERVPQLLAIETPGRVWRAAP